MQSSTLRGDGRHYPSRVAAAKPRSEPRCARLSVPLTVDDSVRSARSQPGTVERTENSCSSPKNDCSTLRADHVYPRPCPDTTPDTHPATRGFAIRQIRPSRGDRSRHAPGRSRDPRGAAARPDRRPWRAGLRIQRRSSLAERDLDPGRGALLVRHGKGGKRREVGMDEWGWEQLRPWLERRAGMPIGPLFCVINGPTCGRPWSAPPHGRSCGASPSTPASGDASLRTSSVTPTPSRWLVKACRSTSSSASSATPTSASRRSICRASTTPR